MWRGCHVETITNACTCTRVLPDLDMHQVLALMMLSCCCALHTKLTCVAVAASQVHRARLADGTQVVVKVQRPGLKVRPSADDTGCRLEPPQCGATIQPPLRAQCFLRHAWCQCELAESTLLEAPCRLHAPAQVIHSWRTLPAVQQLSNIEIDSSLAGSRLPRACYKSPETARVSAACCCSTQTWISWARWRHT